MKGNLRMG